MGRKPKNYLDYFPHPTVQSTEVDFLVAWHGAEGKGIFYGLLEMVYGAKGNADNHGYYTEFDKNHKVMFATQNKLQPNKLDDVISYLIDNNLFIKSIYEDHKVLTGTWILEQFLFVKKQGRNASVLLRKKYLEMPAVEEMASESEYAIKIIDSEFIRIYLDKSGKNPIDSEKTGINSGKGAQRKGKERKGKNRIEEKREKDTSITPTEFLNWFTQNTTFQHALRTGGIIPEKTLRQEWVTEQAKRFCSEKSLEHGTDYRKPLEDWRSHFIHWTRKAYNAQTAA